VPDLSIPIVLVLVLAIFAWDELNPIGRFPCSTTVQPLRSRGKKTAGGFEVAALLRMTRTKDEDEDEEDWGKGRIANCAAWRG
jgi:hypothetical protein